MAHFSRRAEQVAEHTAVLTAEFVDAHGRQPTVVESERLRSRATVATRPAKSHHSLSELTESWRERASAFVPAGEQRGWAASLAGRNDLPLLRASDLADELLADAAEAVVAEVSGRRATFGRLNLLAEAHRVLHGVRFSSPAERMTVAGRRHRPRRLPPPWSSPRRRSATPRRATCAPTGPRACGRPTTSSTPRGR